jgi:chromosome segregation ATPase
VLKKVILSVVGVVAVTGFLFGRDACSYLKTGYRQVTDGVKQSVPTEFQIERAENMVADLAPVIRDSMHLIAKEEVKLAQLDKQIAEREQSTAKLQGEIMQLQADLTSSKNKSVFRYAGREYKRDQVERDLSGRFSRFKVDEETLEHLKQMRDARAAHLEAARLKFGSLVAAQKKLATDIENLKAKKNLVDVAQASSEIVFDDSQLARAKELIAEIHSSLDVKARLANANVNVETEIPLDSSESGDIADQVAAYFNLGDPNGEVATVSHQE